MHRLFLIFCVVFFNNVATNLIAQSKRPNIIFIITDSHRGDALGIEGHPFVETPHLDRLANEGIRFSNTYVTTAICVVSRASILSGQHKARHGINDFSTTFTTEAFKETYPALLKANGYSTTQFGFLGVGKGAPADLFDLYDDQSPWMTKEGIHHTDNITKKALDFLDNYQQDKPFYLALSYYAAHEIDGQNGQPATYLVQERFKGHYEHVTMPIPSTSTESHWNSFPDFFRTDQNIARQRWDGFLSTPTLHQENSKNYYRLLTGLDDAVGKVMQKVKDLKLDKNTIIIYTSDHGFSLGEHGLMGKWYGFEKSIHVPLIIHGVKGKKLSGGRKFDQLALNIDVAPTILSLAQISPPKNMQGYNLLKMIENRKMDRPYFFYEHSILPSPLLPKVEGLISKDYKYFNYIEHNYESLYDMRLDPEETSDVARDEKYAKKLNEIRKLYAEERKKVL